MCVKEIFELASDEQHCLGQFYGIAFAIHSLRQKIGESSTEALLFLDAQNAFDLLNRGLVMNCEIVYPALYQAIYNSSELSALFVDKKQLLSRENTTQRYNLAKATYGMAILPLTETLKNERIMQ